MTTTYMIHAWCDRPFIAGLEIDAETPEEAIAIARPQQHKTVTAVVEDGDVHDDATGKKPTRSIHALTGELSRPRAEKLRHLIAND